MEPTRLNFCINTQQCVYDGELSRPCHGNNEAEKLEVKELLDYF